MKLSEFMAAAEKIKEEKKLEEALKANLAKKEYADSADFTNEFYTIGTEISSLVKILDSKRFRDYIIKTQENFDAPGCKKAASDLLAAVKEAESMFNKLDKIIDKAA